VPNLRGDLRVIQPKRAHASWMARKIARIGVVLYVGIGLDMRVADDEPQTASRSCEALGHRVSSTPTSHRAGRREEREGMPVEAQGRVAASWDHHDVCFFANVTTSAKNSGVALRRWVLG